MEPNNTRIKEHYGIITSDTNTQQFRFLITPPKNKTTIQKHDIITIDHPTQGETNPILAEVTEIQSYEEIITATMTERTGKMLATANILGTTNLKNHDRPLQKLLIPPNPGSRVYMPYPTFLEDTLNRNPQGKPPTQPLHLGKTRFTAVTAEEKHEPLNYYLDAENLTRNHTLIAAADGTGKTHLATVLIEETANKTKHHIVILDPHGEYNNIGKPADPTPPEGYHFNFTTTTISAKNKHETKDTVAKELNGNQILILNAQEQNPHERRNFYTNTLNQLWKNRLNQNTEPFILALEEPENLKGATLDELAADGAKHGVTLILITAHPAELSGKTLTTTATHITGKTTDPEDLKLLTNMAAATQENLAGLAAHEWIVNGVNLPRPTTVTCRKRYSAQPSPTE